MSCKDLKNLDQCFFNISGIRRFYVFLFESINQYRYENDDLNFISSYSTLILPVSYSTNEDSSNYTGVKNLTDIRSYAHSATMNLGKLSDAVRGELKKLEGNDLTVIFEDRNGNSWIIGQDTPAKIESIQLATGQKSGSNEYNVVVSSNETNQLRRIETPSASCFTSFTGLELRRQELIIENASTLPLEAFRFAADTNEISYLANPSLNPTQWSTDPNKYSSDLAQLNAMFSGGGSIVGLVANYSDLTDAITINIDSIDTTFGALIVDNTPQPAANVVIILNLNAVLSPSIANQSTIIEVSDSQGVLYSGGYDTIISGIPEVIGRTNNSILIASNLYPTGTVLTMKLTNVPCSTITYIYNFENTLEICELTNSYEFFKGEKIKVNIPLESFNTPPTINTPPRFQNLNINLLSFVFTMYDNFDDWHNDFNRFKNDLTLMLSQIALPIDVNSIQFIDNGNSIDVIVSTVGEVAQDANRYSKSFIRAVEPDSNTNTGWTQSRVLNLSTFAPFDANITQQDQFSNNITGQNLVSIDTVSGFELGNTPLSNNQTIDNIGLVWAFDGSQPYNETSSITSSSVSPSCLTPSLTRKLTSCYDSFVSASNENYTVISLDVSTGSIDAGNAFDFVLNIGTFFIALPMSLKPNSGSHLMCNEINRIKGLQVLHYEFNPEEQEYQFHLKFDSNISILSVVELNNNRAFNLGQITPVYTNTLTQKTNPYSKLNWILPTARISAPTGLNELTVGHWQEVVNMQNVCRIRFRTNTGVIQVINQTHSEITVMLFGNNYPTSLINDIANVDVSSGQTDSTLQTELANSGLTVLDVKFALVLDKYNRGYVVPCDFSSNRNYRIQNKKRTPVTWGTMDNISYIGTSPTTTEPEYLTIDSGCLPLGVFSASITQLTADDFELKVIVNGSTFELVETIEVVFSEYDGTEPIPTEVTISAHTSTNNDRIFKVENLTFDDPSAVNPSEPYTVIVDLKDSQGNSILSVEIVIVPEIL